MNKIMNVLMLSCKKASELIEKKSFVGLSLKENVQLKMHTSMCDACTAYKKQSELLDRILHEHINADNETIPKLMNDSLKKRIVSIL